MTVKQKFMEPGQQIWSRDKSMLGVPTGTETPCNLEGCNGVKISTKWSDGRRSFPCSKGLVADDDGNMRIG